MTTNFSQTAAYIWSLADLLRGDFKQLQYGRVILPFTILRRLECVLAARKPQVLAEVERLKAMPQLEAAAREKFLLRAAGQAFYNSSPMDLSKLGSTDIKSNLTTYVESFSTDAREIFEHFKFADFVGQLAEANLLFKVVQRVAAMDLSPAAITSHDMGLVFEELIRRFAESSNETAGEHFTPRDIVRLTTSLVFMEDDAALTEAGIIRTIYDPTAGTGGFLSSGMEYVHELNPRAVMRAFGQELNPESYAICKGDMLIKGQDVSRIKLGNTLSDDQLAGDKFDYMLANPPFGVDWKKVEGAIKQEHTVKGFAGRFGPGLPRVSDGSLLFLLHLISKLRDYDPNDPTKNGGRIGIILNGSPLFTGGAGSGESEIRRYILENDLLEAIVALPTDMFYNTGIATYIWILSNKKRAARKGQVQLINGVHLYQKMRKSLGSKRQEISDDGIALITRTFGDFAAVASYRLDGASATLVMGEDEPDEDEPGELDPGEDGEAAAGSPDAAMTGSRGRPSAKKKAEKKRFGSKIFASHEFGYRRLTIERPLRLSVQLSDERLAGLRFAPGPLNAAMQAIAQRALHWSAPASSTSHAVTSAPHVDEAEIRALIKADFSDLKEAQIKELLDPKTWRAQQELLAKARTLQRALGSDPCDDFNAFDSRLTQALKATDTKLDAKERKQFLDAVSWTNPAAAPVIKRVIKGPATPLYGAFAYQGQVVEFQPDSDLRDNEDVPLTAQSARGVNVNAVNEAYFAKEVAPHVPDAWIDGGKCDPRDGQVGLVGYEIPFNRHFYEYEPTRDLAAIDADLDRLSAEIMAMLREVHS
jgi:type I restriction enzyme M protein